MQNLEGQTKSIMVFSEVAYCLNTKFPHTRFHFNCESFIFPVFIVSFEIVASWYQGPVGGLNNCTLPYP